MIARITIQLATRLGLQVITLLDHHPHLLILMDHHLMGHRLMARHRMVRHIMDHRHRHHHLLLPTDLSTKMTITLPTNIPLVFTVEEVLVATLVIH
jgi:hypothetical protein